MKAIKIGSLAIFASFLALNISFYLVGLLSGKTVFHFANQANTDGVSYYNIALAPFKDPPADSGFRYATFLYPLVVSLIAGGNPFATAIVMEIVNILAFSLSLVFFYQLAKIDGFSIATVFYAFNPILLISVHGGMNEPLYYALMFGGLLMFRKEKFLPSALFLSLAVISRPDFFIFALPYFALAKGKKFLPYLMIILAATAGFGYYLVSRFTLEHFLQFASGSDLPPQLGIPFATFLYNRFFGASGTFQIRGFNLILNEAVAWAVFASILFSIYFAARKKHRDWFSLSLIALGSVIQPAYSYFSGYFRFISMAPSLYKVPSLLLKGRLVQMIAVIYAVAGFGILVAWFF
ncbi:MAG: hypothetical protein HYU02_05310 [Thaumarchaeota archaeon]|nr:hypothetical protein [Nitrososphaerota archaeon]